METLTLRQLRKMGKEQGIKYATVLNTVQLCEKLGIPLVRNQAFDTHNRDKINTPVCIHFVNSATGEKELEFPSIYKAAKYIGVNPGSIPFYIKNKKIIKIEKLGKEKLCSVKRIERSDQSKTTAK